MRLIATHGLSVRLGAQLALHDIDLAVDRGEIVTVVGPNGSGKTTLLRALVGAVAPSAGRVEQMPGLRIGYVPQRLHLDATLPITVARFLRLGARQRNGSIARALEDTGVPDLAGRQMTALSGGQFQRVLLARALLSEPDLLLLDEPAQGLDQPGMAALYRLVGAVRDRMGCGVLMVSHDLHVVMGATDRVIALNGVIWCEGPPVTVSSLPNTACCSAKRSRARSPSIATRRATAMRRRTRARRLPDPRLPCGGRRRARRGTARLLRCLAADRLFRRCDRPCGDPGRRGIARLFDVHGHWRAGCGRRNGDCRLDTLRGAALRWTRCWASPPMAASRWASWRSLWRPPRAIDVDAYLFGEILAVTRTDLAVIWGGAAAVLGLVVWRWSALLTATLSPELARGGGIDPEREQLAMTIAIAILVAVSIKVVGALLITAMLIIPAAAARRSPARRSAWRPARP